MKFIKDKIPESKKKFLSIYNLKKYKYFILYISFC